ncbi:helicase-related protein [Streptomyces rimosus]|uniref:helicase-related protein n=1 Tax=Streptomyces rimosus TaxID=1927 RepID=UPI00131CE66D|nr:SNF2-related protein [Streptomyces rimosus]
MQITNAADRLASRLEAKARRPWNPDLHPRDSKGRFIETGGIARLWGGGMARVLRALGGRDVLVENLSTHERSTINGSRLTMVARPDGTAPTRSKKKVRDEDERRQADGRRGTGRDDEDAGDHGDTPDEPHDTDDQGNAIGEDRDGEDHGAGPEPEDDEPEEDPQPKPSRRRDPNRRFKTLEDVRAHWASGKLRTFTQDEKKQDSHNKFMAELMDKLDKPQLSRNGHFVVGRLTIHGSDGREHTGWGVMHTDTGIRLTLADRKAEATEFANRMESVRIGGEPIDWNNPESFDRLNTPEGRSVAGRLAAEAQAAFAERAKKKREGATARTKPATPSTPEQRAAQQVAGRTGAPAANVAVGHIGAPDKGKSFGDERGRPRNDGELREFWQQGGAQGAGGKAQAEMKKLANDPNVVLHLADHRGFVVVEQRRRNKPTRYELRTVGTAATLSKLGRGGIHTYGSFDDPETANRFALYLGSNLRDRDGRTVDWGSPSLSSDLFRFRDKEGQPAGQAIWQLAGEFDRQRGVHDSPAARFSRPHGGRDDRDEEHQQDPQTAPETPDTGIPGEDVTPRPADGQQRDEQEEHSSGERLQGAGEGVLGDVPADGAGRAGGDDAAGDVLRADGGGDRGADRGQEGRLPGGDGAGDGLPGRDGVDQHGDDEGEGSGPARAGVRPEEGAGHGGQGDAQGEPAEDRSRVAFGSDDEERRAPQYQPPEDGRSLVPSGVRARVKANIAAIEVLRRLEDENRPATAAEQETLARWSGWGATPQVFVDEPKEEFVPLQARLRELLSDAEWDAAKENTLNAHYTDPAITREVWKAVEELGFDGGNVLEPGSGSGNFIGYAPESAHMTGVELDPITAGISKALYPHADIRNEGFEKTRAADGTFDMAIGNVPFGDYQVVDLRHNKGGHNIHNHFILKSLDLTRPGGLVAVVTSRFTMDGSTPRAEDARMEMARKADLVGAVRLPTGAHRRTAGTDVVTDLLIFRRREKDKEFTSGRLRNGQIKMPDQRTKDDPPVWVHSARVTDLPGQDPDDANQPDAPQVYVNPYFLTNPNNVLGEMAVGHGMYGPGELRVDGDGNLDTSLSKALKKIVKRARDAGLSYTPDDGERRRPELLPEGSDRIDGHVQVSPDGTFTQVRDGVIVPFDVPRKQVEEATQLLGLRDAMKALIAEESRPDADEALIETLRGDLKARYEAYHAKFGSLNRFDWATRKAADPETGEQVDKAYRKRPPMGGLITRDPTMAVVLSLDTYDGTTGTSTPAAIFSKRQSRHRTIADRASSPEDAMAVVLEQKGSLDTNTLARVMGVTPQVAREKLLAARSTDPETGHEYPLVFEPHNGGDLIPAADYLSGNVRARLEEAQALAGEDPRFDINVKQLEAVLPPDISPGEIDAPMGASWLGGEIVQSFLREKLNTNTVRVSYAGGSLWKVDAPDATKKSRAATEVWGTEDFPAIKLAETILTNGRIRVTFKDDEGKTYVDEDATAAAQAKAEELKEEFQDWLWASPARSEQIKKLYNNTHNNLALRSYDGQRRTMPGLADWFKPHPHQHAAVARMVNEPAVLLAHEVGAGKTAEMTMGVMELRRLGLINKAAIVVPNHMLQQFHDEFAELYPESAAQGRILSASSEDLQGRKRREFIARVATGDYDAVILTQNAFESIPMRPEVQLDYIKREKKHLEEALRRQKEQDELEEPGKRRDSRMVKELQKRLKQLEAKIAAKIETSKDMAGLYFEDTGIDYVVVDEAHHYKNLTTNSSIPGAAIEGANRASDLDMKLEYLRKNTKSGRVVTFATATPISNSVTEAHTMLRYLRPDLLEAAKVRNFDEFASTYGKVVSGVELAADGSGFKEVSRFAAFRNMPELLRIWKTVADVKTSEDLAEYLDTPDISGGKAITISVEPTEQMLAYQEELARRARDVKQGDVDPRDDNMLKISSDGRKVSLDPRMVGLDEQGNKLPRAAENIARIYEETKDAVYPTSKTDPTPHETPGGLQIVFLDMGTPKDPGKGKKKGKSDGPASVEELGDSPFPAYQELKELLIAQGVPAEKIRFIHEAKNDAEKARLFADARNGKIAVLVGSTSKMGTGTNVQLRATALHHLDCPWRPADLEQRNGRIIRQGNANPEVAIFQYVTEQSFDGFSWQTVARKAKFIRQLMKGNLTDRTVEDIPDGVFNAEQVTAISTGNPYLLEQANVKASLAVLKRKLKGHLRAVEGYKTTIHAAEKLREDTDKFVAQLQDVISRRKNTRGDAFNATIGKNDFTKRGEAAKALATAAQAVLRQGKADPYRSGGHQKVVIGRVGNIEVTAQYRTAWGDYGRVHLVDIAFPDIPRSRHSYQEDDLKKDSTLPITRLEDSLADVDKAIVRAESRLRQEERAAETARARVDRPFEQAEELEAAERRAKLVGALIREQGKQTTSEDAGRAKRARLESLEHQLREARIAAGEDSGDVDDPAAAQDTDLLPRTPAPPSITTDEKGRPRVLWPDAEAKKAAKEREKQAKLQRAREERGETTLNPEQVRSELDSLREDAPEAPEQHDDSSVPEEKPEAPDAPAPTDKPDTDTGQAQDGEGEETTTLTPERVRADLDSITPEDRDDAKTEDRTDSEGTDAAPNADSVQDHDQADAEPADTSSGQEETTPAADASQPADNDESEAEDEAPAGDFPAPGDQVNSPDGLGEVMAVHGDAVLVRAERGTRSHALKDVTRPDGSPFGGDRTEAHKERQNAEKIAQAATHEGAELSSGNRLRDLDMEAGHGTIVDRDGNTVGWVRARIGDDGRRYWWGQDADGGAPEDMQWHEELPAQAGAAPIRAASIVRDGLDSLRAKYTGRMDANGRPEQEKRKPVTPDRAITEMTLTPAQVRELSKLTLSGEYADGTPIDTLPWNPGHRRYSPFSAQAGALATAAREAAAQQDESTPEGRRNKKVLIGAARKMEFQQYDSARRAATVPPPGEPDAYDKPYEPRAEEPDTDAPDRDAPDPASEQTAPDTGRGTSDAPSEPQETDAEPADDSEVLDPDQAQVGDYIRAETQNTRGNADTREGYLLAAPKKVTATRDRQRIKAWRLYIGKEGEEPSPRNAVTILPDEKIERLTAPEPTPEADHDTESTDSRTRDSAPTADAPEDSAATGSPAEGDDVPSGQSPLSFPNGGTREEEVRKWAGVWAGPQPDGLSNVYLDRVLGAHDGQLPSDPWETRFWITSAFEVDPMAQYDENLRHSLDQVPEEARQYLTGHADELRSFVQQLGDDLRTDIRSVLVDNIATRAGRKKAREQVARMYNEAAEKARKAVREHIERVRADAAEHGLSEQQAEGFLINVAGGDNPDQMSYGVKGEFPEAVRPLYAARLDGEAYRAAFGGWATQDDTNSWAGFHHSNVRRARMNVRLTPVADPRAAAGELKIGEAELPKGMRWARASELREGDIFHYVRVPRRGTADAFDGMEPPQYVIHTHRDGLEGALRTVGLDGSHHDPDTDGHVIIVENPEPAVRKRARHRARTDVFTNWELRKDEEAYAAQSRLPSHPEGETVDPETLAKGELVRLRGTNQWGGLGQFEGYLHEAPQRTRFWRQGKETEGWKVTLASNPEQLQNPYATGWDYYIAADDNENWVERIDSMQARSASVPLSRRGDVDAPEEHDRPHEHDEQQPEGQPHTDIADEGDASAPDSTNDDDHGQERREEEERQGGDDDDRRGRGTRRRSRDRDGDNEPDGEDGPGLPDAGAPTPNDDDHENEDDGDAERPDANDQDHDDRDERGRRKRRRRRDRDRDGRDGGAPDGGLPHMPGLPHVPDLGSNQGGDDSQAGNRTRKPDRLAQTKDRYRNGSTPTPPGADPEGHAAYLRRLADNDTLTLSPGGGLITWSDDDGRTWQFGHATSGVHLAGWEANGEEIGGRDGAVRLAGEYERMLGEDGAPIDWTQPQLDADALRQWRDSRGELLTDAIAFVRDSVIREHQRDSDRNRLNSTPTTDIAAPDTEPTVGTGATDTPNPNRRPRSEAAGQDTDSSAGQADETQAGTGGAPGTPASTPASGPDTAAPGTAGSENDEGRVGDGAPFGDPELDLRPFMSNTGDDWEDRIITDEATIRRFGSLERMRELASRATVPSPQLPTDHGASEVWLNGRLIGSVNDEDSYNRTLYPESYKGMWHAKPEFFPTSREPVFRSREAAIAEVVLRALKAGPPDPTKVTGEMADDFKLWRDMFFPKNVDGQDFDDQDRERYEALDKLVTELAAGRTPSGNLAADLGHAVDELGWLASRYRKGKDEEHTHIDPSTLARHFAKTLDHLRPEDPRAAHHRELQYRAAMQAIRDLDTDDVLDHSEQVSIAALRDGDVVIKLEGRRATGSTTRRTGYLRGAPKKVTIRSGGEKIRAYRVRVGDTPWDDGGREEKLTVPIDTVVHRRASLDQVEIREDQQDYGLRVGQEAPEHVYNPETDGIDYEGRARAQAQQADGLRSTDDADTDNAPEAAADTDHAPAKPEPNTETREPASADEPETAPAPAQAAPKLKNRPTDKPTRKDQPAPAPRKAPEPVGGRPAEWVKIHDLSHGDLVRVEGTTKQGTPRTLAGYVVDGPKQIPATRNHRTRDMYRVLIADTPNGKGAPVWVMPDAAAARATRDNSAQVEGAPHTGADADVLAGRIADTVPTDRNGNGIFPGSVVTDAEGNDGVVTGASASSVRARFGDSRSEEDHSPTSLHVTDGGAARPTGWTGDGHRVRTGNVVGEKDGTMLGTVEEVDGDTATVAIPGGMSEHPIGDLRVIGDTNNGNDGNKVTTVEPADAGEVKEGDVLVRDTPEGPRTARITGRSDDGEQINLDLTDTTTGETDTMSVPSSGGVLRARDADGNAPDLGPEDGPSDNAEITSHEPAPAVDPVAGPTVNPQLSPEERDAIADRGQTATADPDAEQAAARIANDLPVTPEQASALADELREGADSDTADGRAARRAADHLDAAAGNEPDGETSNDRPEPGTVGTVGVGDTIALPDEFTPDTLTAYRVVDIQDGPGGVRSLTVEDGDGQRFKRTLASADPLYQLPEPEAPAGDPEAEPRDPNPAPDPDRLRADYRDAVVRAVIDSAVQGTTTPGSVHQLREQIAQQLTPEALRASMRRARNGAVAAITDAGIEGDDREALVRSLRREAATARTDAIRAALRTLDDFEAHDGESEEDTARRAADALRLIPEALRNRPNGDDNTDGAPHANDAVTQHADDAIAEALRAAAADGPLTEERRAAIIAQLAARLAANRDATARQIAENLPAGRRPGVIAHIVAGLALIARKIVAMVTAFLKALAKGWQRSREGLRRMRERLARFRRSLAQRIRTWPETRRLRRLAAATDLPGHADGLPLGDRIAHWTRLLPAPGRFGQVSRRARWYRPATRSSLASGQLPPIQDGVRWTMDRAVDGGPGPQALRHLAALRAAGHDVDADVATRLSAAAPELGDDPHGTVRHASRHADNAEQRLRDLEAAAAGGAPDADLEIAAARVEAETARQEAGRLQQAYAAALPAAVLDTLAGIREMGPGTTATLVTTPDSDPAAVRALNDIARYVPRDWLAPTEARFIGARGGDAGAYDPRTATATVADLGDGGQRTAAHALLAHLQQHYPDLLAAQEAFHFTRTHRGRVGARRRTELDQLLARLFRNRTNGDGDDLVPLGLATLFSGDWYEDDDLRAFLLGLLATR